MVVEIKSQVFVGICDIAEVGARVLLELCMGSGLSPTSLRLSGDDVLEPFFSVTTSGMHEDLPCIALFTTKEASFVIVNSCIPSSSRAKIMHALVQKISEGFPNVNKSLSVVGALRIRHQTATEGPYAVAMEETDLPCWANGLEVLPSSLPVEDGSIAMMMHYARAMEVPLSGVFVQGFRQFGLQVTSPATSQVQELSGLLRKATNLNERHSVTLDIVQHSQPMASEASFMFL